MTMSKMRSSDWFANERIIIALLLAIILGSCHSSAADLSPPFGSQIPSTRFCARRHHNNNNKSTSIMSTTELHSSLLLRGGGSAIPSTTTKTTPASPKRSNHNGKTLNKANPCGSLMSSSSSSSSLTNPIDHSGRSLKPSAPTPDSGQDVTSNRSGGGGRSSFTSSIFNLVNNVAGAGILALSAGKAAGTGWIPAFAICTTLGIVSARTFCMIGEACEMVHEPDFKGLWSRTMGAKSNYVVDSMIATLCLAVAVIYSTILGDVFTPLLEQAGLPGAYNGRTSNILAITIAFLLPMSLIKNLSALAFTSMLGFAAIMYTVFFIAVRSLDGTYRLGSGKFVTDGVLKLLPTFEKSTLWHMDFTSLVLASNLGLAYIAHYNAPSFYRELENTSPRRFGQMTGASFFVLIVLYIVTMAAGYRTFGDHCQGNILLNYHPNDILSTLGRLATGFSILFGFPLVAAGARESLIGVASSLGMPAVGAEKNHFLLVVSILTLVTLISCAVQDVSLVVGLTGAAMGSFIVYICPALLYTKAVRLVKGPGSPDHKKAQWNLLLVPFGTAIAALGMYMTIQESMSS